MSNLIIDPHLVKPTKAEQVWAFIEDLKLKIKTQNYLFFDIGARLKVVRDQRLYLKLDGGYSSFDEFLLQAEIGFKRRTAYNYIELYEYYVQELALDEEVLTKTPYYRLLEMKRQLKGKSVEEAKEIVIEQSEIPTQDYRKLKVEKGMTDKRPQIYEHEGKWVIKFYPEATYKITNLTTNHDIFHE